MKNIFKQKEGREWDKPPNLVHLFFLGLYLLALNHLFSMDSEKLGYWIITVAVFILIHVAVTPIAWVLYEYGQKNPNIYGTSPKRDLNRKWYEPPLLVNLFFFAFYYVIINKFIFEKVEDSFGWFSAILIIAGTHYLVSFIVGIIYFEKFKQKF